MTCPLGIAFFHLIKNHQTSSKVLTPHLKSRDSALSIRQYYRLMAMSIILGIWGVVWISIEIQVIATDGSYPIPSWKDIHKGDSDIIELPTIIMGPTLVHQLYLLWWGIPGAAFLFFLLFGTSYDVLYEYVKFWAWFRMTVLRQPLREKAVAMSTIRSQYVFLFSSSPLPYSSDFYRSAPSYRIDTSTVVHDDLESKLPISPDQSFGSAILHPSKD
jgi:hypothetical protein